MVRRDYTYNYSKNVARARCQQVLAPRDIVEDVVVVRESGGEGEKKKKLNISIDHDALMYAGIGALAVLAIQAIVSVIASRFKSGQVVMIDGKKYMPL